MEKFNDVPGGGAPDFEVIYRDLKKPVMKYAMGCVKDRHHAEELTQEVFVKVFRFLATYNPAYPFQNWFWTVVKNATRDWCRRSAVSALSYEASGSDPADLPSSEANAEKLLLKRFWAREAFRKLRVLTRMQRKVLWLRVRHDLPHQEIARRLGLSVASVKCLLSRARQTLKETPEFASV